MIKPGAMYSSVYILCPFRIYILKSLKDFSFEIYHPGEVIVGNLPVHHICIPLSLPHVNQKLYLKSFILCRHYISNILVTQIKIKLCVVKIHKYYKGHCVWIFYPIFV